MTVQTAVSSASLATPTASASASTTALSHPDDASIGAEADALDTKPRSFQDKIAFHANDSLTTEAAARTMPRISAIGCAYGDSLHEVHIHANHREGGDFEFPRGQTLVFDAEAPLCDASFLHTNMFGQIAAVQILGIRDAPTADLTDDYFTRKAAAFSRLREESATPPRISVVDKVTGADKKTWQAVLGKHGFVGIYRCEKRANCPEFFIVAYVNETPIGYDAWCAGQVRLRRTVMSVALTRSVQERQREGATIGAYAKSERMRNARRLAQRNVKRILAEAADFFGVRVNRIRDLSACPLTQNGPLPFLAVPAYMCEFNTVRYDEVEKRVYVYDHAVDMTTATNGVIFPINPCDGIWVLRTHTPGAGLLVGPGSDVTAHSLPLGLGSATPTGRRISPKDAARFVWAGKEDGVEAPPCLNSDAYRAFTKDKQAFVRALCGTPSETCRVERLKLLPVAVRITSTQ